MRKSRIKRKLENGQPVLITLLHFIDPVVYELTSLLGFDGIWMDLEHHPTSVETAANLMRAARLGHADIIARPAKGEFTRMQRLLEAGAQGIMYPRCDTAEEAREVVKWAKFAPLGKRGFDGSGPDMPYCMMPVQQYIEEANAETFTIIQLEEQEAIEQSVSIAEVDGVDILMLGPADFSVLSGIAGQFDHEYVKRAREIVAAAANAAGKHWGMPCRSVEDANELLDMGATVLFHSADILMVKQGLERIRDKFSSLGFTFGDDPQPVETFDLVNSQVL
jgi:4-hydroxy-2-oxoheptanedioate aldolase